MQAVSRSGRRRISGPFRRGSGSVPACKNGAFGILALESSVLIRTIVSTILFLAFAGAVSAQPEVMAWGNLTGIRVDGHLLELATSICVAQPELAGVGCTGPREAAE